SLRAAELDGGEVHADDLQSMFGQRPGCRYPGPAAEIDDPGPGRQQAGQFGDPPGIAGGVLSRGGGRLAVIAAVGDRDRVVAAPPQIALPGPPRPALVPHPVSIPDRERSGWLRPYAGGAEAFSRDEIGLL